MIHVISLISAVIPSVLIIWYFYKKDLYPEPGLVITKTFFLGIFIIIPVLIVALPLLTINPFTQDPFNSALYSAFITAAIPEEFFKFIVIIWFCIKNPAFDEPMDGIVYGVVVSLGFATLENILYVIQGGWGVAIMRALTAVPAHATWGAIMGFFIGQSVFDKKHKVSIVLGLIIAVFLHGSYDTALMFLSNTQDSIGIHEIMMSEVYAILSFLIVFIFGIIWSLSIVKRLRKRQEEQKSQIL
ncbi:MAG: PrsW family intramembrane metalloprotease [Candidatus Delongbacteria bacterium]|nr:PrsW family intramembrane metalloprotease [Candidatus Delongbacteria bacterium]